MHNKMCCNGGERAASLNSLSPRPATARVVEQKRVAGPISAWSSALDRRENQELRQIFDVAISTNAPTDPRRVINPDEHQLSRKHVRKSPSQLVTTIKQHLSRRSLKSSASHDHRITSSKQPPTNSISNSESYSQQAFGDGGYDSDAQPLLSISSLQGSLWEVNQADTGRSSSKARSEPVNVPLTPDLTSIISDSGHQPGTASYTHSFTDGLTDDNADVSCQVGHHADDANRNKVLLLGQNDTIPGSAKGCRMPIQEPSSCYSPVESVRSGPGSSDKPTQFAHSVSNTHSKSDHATNELDLARYSFSLQASPYDRPASEPVVSSHSLHLQNMRISQHLRSMSTFSDGSVCTRSLGVGSVCSGVDCYSEPHSIAGCNAVLVPPSIEPLSFGVQPAIYLDVHEPYYDAKSIGRDVALDMGCNDDKRNPTYGILPDSSTAHSISSVTSRKYAARETSLIACEQSGNMDGPSDQYLQVARSSMPGQSTSEPRSGSVAENIDETAVLWSRAMTSLQVRESVSRKQSRSSFSLLTSASRRHSRNHGSTSAAAEPIELTTRTSVSPVLGIEIAPISTEHSFDLLTIPGRGSIDHTLDHPLRGARNSVGQSHLFEIDKETITQNSALVPEIEKVDHANQSVPAARTGFVEVPQITLSEPDQPLRPLKRAIALPESDTSLNAWCRFPSHNREGRNGSAGLADNVIVRDFAPVVPVAEVNDEESDSDTASRRKKHKKKRRAAKFRSLIWHAKNLSGWPTNFVQRNSDFYQRGSGHRTSISLGGVVEYPELELLPGLEARLTPEWNETFAMTSMSRGRPSMSIHGSSRRPSHLSRRVSHTEEGSPTSERKRNASMTGPSDQHVAQSSGWLTSFYAHDHSSASPSSKRRGTEFVSPFDGSSHTPCDSNVRKPSELQSTSTLSLTLLPLKPRNTPWESEDVVQKSIRATVSAPLQAVWPTASADELRKSTKDLRELLQGRESSEAERAVSAMGFWES